MVRVKSFRFKVWSFGFRVKGYRVSRVPSHNTDRRAGVEEE